MLLFEDTKIRLAELQKEYNKISELLSFEEVLTDTKLYLHLDKKKRLLEPIAEKYREYLRKQNDIDELLVVLSSISTNEKMDFEQELLKLQEEQENIKNDLSKLLQKFDAIDQRIIVEMYREKSIASGKLLDDLKNAYFLHCENLDLKCNQTQDKNCTRLEVSGLNAYQVFEKEIGLHKCISSKESGACQVFVYDVTSLPQNDFFEKDVVFETCRSSGAGGQHINTTDSAIKAIHLPTGISAICQDERSQFQNKEKALIRLKAKVNEKYLSHQKDILSIQKKEQLKKFSKYKFVRVYDYDTLQIYIEDKSYDLNNLFNAKIF